VVALPGTFIISRIDMKRMLTSMGISESSIEGMLSSLNKMHRHVNVVAFVGMLQKLGPKAAEVSNLLRRIGIDDVTITDIFNTLDEEKIKSTFGRVVTLVVE
jgi:hypothetical protein